MFEFRDPGSLRDGELELVLVEKFPGDSGVGQVPAYRFDMRLTGTGKRVGSIDLRIGETERVVSYTGQIGYRVLPEHRGHSYAARGCKLLLPLARAHGLGPLWITCDPDNAASRRTCELAGAELVEVVDLPKDDDLYRRGEKRKCRYKIEL